MITHPVFQHCRVVFAQRTGNFHSLAALVIFGRQHLAMKRFLHGYIISILMVVAAGPLLLGYVGVRCVVLKIDGFVLLN